MVGPQGVSGLPGNDGREDGGQTGIHIAGGDCGATGDVECGMATIFW